MKKYIVTWEERYKIIIEANSKKEAEEKWEELTEEEMRNAYAEDTLFEVVEEKD